MEIEMGKLNSRQRGANSLDVLNQQVKTRADTFLYLPVWPVLSIMTSFFAGMSSSGTAKSTVKRSETIKHLYEQVHWNDLIKAEILRQRDVR